jgi:RND family efflux transporter MFP subunit
MQLRQLPSFRGVSLPRGFRLLRGFRLQAEEPPRRRPAEAGSRGFAVSRVTGPTRAHGAEQHAITTAVVVALPLFAAACGGGHPEKRRIEQPPIDVTSVTVTAADLPRAYEAGGVVRARVTAAITSRLLAPVVDVRVSPGDRVRAGQVLARLDDRDLSAAERRASSGTQAAEQAGRVAASERDAAEAALALATAHHTRVTMLHERKSATDDELDQAVAGLRAARSRLAAAEARVAETGAGLSAAAAGADAATVSASWAVITAPFDGVITEKLVEAGNMAAPGMPLFRIEQAGPMRLDVRLDESRAAGIRTGQEAEVQFDADREGQRRQVTGRVAEIARAVEAGAHAYLVKIELPPDARVPSGAFARARFTGPSRRVLALPATAVVRRGQVASVYVLNGDRAQLRLVDVGDAMVSSNGADLVEVVAGLSAGEHVVASPPPALRDGARVRDSGGAPTQAQEAR